jgi:hypothetical protein
MVRSKRMTTLPLPSKNGSAAAPAADIFAHFDGTNINPRTLLATDFLNHFNEAIMLLEMLPAAPECKEDFLAWRPMSYREHFAASHFKHRDLAIAAYEVSDPVFRNELDELAGHMTKILTVTIEGMRHELSPRTLSVLAESTARWLKPLVARAGAVINGELAGPVTRDEPVPQDTVDALFDREVEEADIKG